MQDYPEWDRGELEDPTYGPFARNPEVSGRNPVLDEAAPTASTSLKTGESAPKVVQKILEEGGG